VIVVDTSAVLSALTAGPMAQPLRERLAADGDLHAPHLIDVEVIHALRRLVARGVVTVHRALAVRADFGQLALTRYPHHPLADRMWELRENLTAYDAAFVALSEVLRVPFVTCDARLAAAPGHRLTVEVYPTP
jgi:predicted nucleic acid-binding protein